MTKESTKLSVNINKIATLRNARGGEEPNLIYAAQNIQKFGAQGITVHPRPDERHIKIADVYALKPIINTEFNIEGYPSDTFLKLVKDINPEQVTLVPDPPDVITSNAGWDVLNNKTLLSEVIKKIKPSRTSVFIDPFNTSYEALKMLKDIGADRIELYTEAYARAFQTNTDLDEVLSQYQKMAETALKLGLELNAGHDLNQANLPLLLKHIPQLKEVSIGHALISEALYNGLKPTIQSYLQLLRA